MKRGRAFKTGVVLTAALGLFLAVCVGLLAAQDVPAVQAARPAGCGPTATPAAVAAAEVAVGRVVTYAIVPQDSQLAFSVTEIHLPEPFTRATVSGQTHDIQGQLLLNWDNPSASPFGQFIVNLATLRSDQPERDTALRQQWLESERFPLATFVISAVNNLPAAPIVDEPTRFQLAGTMAIKDAGRPVTWEVTATLRSEGLVGQATTSLRLADFGVPVPHVEGILEVEDGVAVTLDFVMAKVKPPPPRGGG
jgi:polyisoprenoid-binding protein YceI